MDAGGVWTGLHVRSGRVVASLQLRFTPPPPRPGPRRMGPPPNDAALRLGSAAGVIRCGPTGPSGRRDPLRTAPPGLARLGPDRVQPDCWRDPRRTVPPGWRDWGRTGCSRTAGAIRNGRFRLAGVFGTYGPEPARRRWSLVSCYGGPIRPGPGGGEGGESDIGPGTEHSPRPHLHARSQTTQPARHKQPAARTVRALAPFVAPGPGDAAPTPAAREADPHADR